MTGRWRLHFFFSPGQAAALFQQSIAVYPTAEGHLVVRGIAVRRPEENSLDKSHPRTLDGGASMFALVAVEAGATQSVLIVIIARAIVFFGDEGP